MRIDFRALLSFLLVVLISQLSIAAPAPSPKISSLFSFSKPSSSTPVKAPSSPPKAPPPPPVIPISNPSKSSPVAGKYPSVLQSKPESTPASKQTETPQDSNEKSSKNDPADKRPADKQPPKELKPKPKSYADAVKDKDSKEKIPDGEKGELGTGVTKKGNSGGNPDSKEEGKRPKSYADALKQNLPKEPKQPGYGKEPSKDDAGKPKKPGQGREPVKEAERKPKSYADVVKSNLQKEPAKKEQVKELSKDQGKKGRICKRNDNGACEDPWTNGAFRNGKDGKGRQNKEKFDQYYSKTDTPSDWNDKNRAEKMVKELDAKRQMVWQQHLANIAEWEENRKTKEGKARNKEKWGGKPKPPQNIAILNREDEDKVNRNRIATSGVAKKDHPAKGQTKKMTPEEHQYGAGVKGHNQEKVFLNDPPHSKTPHSEHALYYNTGYENQNPDWRGGNVLSMHPETGTIRPACKNNCRSNTALHDANDLFFQLDQHKLREWGLSNQLYKYNNPQPKVPTPNQVEEWRKEHREKFSKRGPDQGPDSASTSGISQAPSENESKPQKRTTKWLSFPSGTTLSVRDSGVEPKPLRNGVDLHPMPMRRDISRGTWTDKLVQRRMQWATTGAENVLAVSA